MKAGVCVCTCECVCVCVGCKWRATGPRWESDHAYNTLGGRGGGVWEFNVTEKHMR